MNMKYPADKDLERLCTKNKLKCAYRGNTWFITIPDPVSPALEKKLYATAAKAQRGGYNVRFYSKRKAPLLAEIKAEFKKLKRALIPPYSTKWGSCDSAREALKTAARHRSPGFRQPSFFEANDFADNIFSDVIFFLRIDKLIAQIVYKVSLQ